MFDNWIDPQPGRSNVLSGNTPDIVGAVYEEQQEIVHTIVTDTRPTLTRDWGIAIAVEAKVRSDQAFTTILSKKVFEEIIKFEQWLYFDIKYDDVPGIPAGDKSFENHPDQLLMYD